ncbi:MAG: ABC-type phosphate/phosphonate transport system substrate-binding protein [Myxococcota bacterium]
MPLPFFAKIAETIGQALGRPVHLSAHYDCSGPAPGDENPFADGQADLGFVCAPSYLALAAAVSSGLAGPTVKLVGVAPVFDDPRNEGRPVYFCDVVVRQTDRSATLDALRGRRFGYNDPMSLSGLWGMEQHLQRRGEALRDFFGPVVQTGSHPASIAALCRGEIDAATLDSTLLLLARRGAHPTIRQDEPIRVLKSIGPWPVQPLVARTDLAPDVCRAIQQALLAAGPWPQYALTGFGAQDHDAISAALPATDRSSACTSCRCHRCTGHSGRPCDRSLRAMRGAGPDAQPGAR